jgi:hypothetical protein
MIHEQGTRDRRLRRRVESAGAAFKWGEMVRDILVEIAYFACD